MTRERRYCSAPGRPERRPARGPRRPCRPRPGSRRGHRCGARHLTVPVGRRPRPPGQGHRPRHDRRAEAVPPVRRDTGIRIRSLSADHARLPARQPLPAGRRPAAGDRRTSSRACATGKPHQTLLGVTGSGKTFTMANVIARMRPAGARHVAQQDARRPALRRVQASSSRTTPSATSSAITTTTSPKPTSPSATSTSRKTPRSTRKSSASAWPAPAPWSAATT